MNTLGVETPKTTAPTRVDDVSTTRLWVTRAIVVAAIALPTIGIFAIPSREAVGFTVILLMFVLLLLRIPVAFALAVPGLLGIYSLSGARALENILGDTPMHTNSQWSLSVLPAFILMGLLLANSGVTSRMYDVARNWLSWLPGGLAVGTNVAGAGLATVSGSTMGTTYALARIGIPEMFKAGYGTQMTIGSVIVAGLPGQLIPPSVYLVVIAGLLNNPVGPQLIAGIVPGITVAFLFTIMIVTFSTMFPKWVGRGKDVERPRVLWSDRWRSLASVWPIAALAVVVLGGMFSGVVTATEAGSLGALGALILCLWAQRKNKPLHKAGSAALETISSVGSIFLMIMGAHVFGVLIGVSGIGRMFSTLIADMNVGRVEFLLILLVVMILLGMFMDPLAMLLTIIPIVWPILPLLEIDPLWFGVFAVFMSEIAILTPPVGILSFVLHRILQDPKINMGNDVKLTDVFGAVGLFLPMVLVTAVLWILFPEIVLWLPGLM